ncbi:MAG: transposase, partial [Phocaeicola sp.]
NRIDNMLHLGPRTFDELSGEVVQNTVFVITNCEGKNAAGSYYRLIEGKNCGDKERMFLEAQENGGKAIVNSKLYIVNYNNVSQQDFEKIPGCPIGYWVSEKVIDSFEHQELNDVCDTRCGMATGRNDYYLRIWFEVSNKNILFNCKTSEESLNSICLWYPYDKAGEFRKWYGNKDYVVKWYRNGTELQNTMHPDGKRVWAHNFNIDKLYQKHIGWSDIISSEGGLSFRYFEEGFLFDGAANAIFEKKGYNEKDFIAILAFANSVIPEYVRNLLNPTIHFKPGNFLNLPYSHCAPIEIWTVAEENISISKQDWDAHETSWDFEENPLLAIGGAVSHCTINNDTANSCCGGTPQLLGESVSHCTINNDSADSCCGGTPQLLKFVNKREYIHINVQQLPHWHQNDCVQFVTFRLADSLPQSKLIEYKQIKDEWLAAHPKPWDDATQEEYDRIIGTKIDKWLDAGYGSCILQDGRIRKIVEDSILHFNGEKYNVHCYVIMPNHVHVLLSPIGDNLVQSIVGSWKKFSAHEINKRLNQTGSVWERESFDRMVRNNEDFDAKLNYIGANPKNLPSSSYTLCMGLCCGGTPQL